MNPLPLETKNVPLEREHAGAPLTDFVDIRPEGGHWMLAIFVGLLFVSMGAYGMFHWRADLVVFLRGFVPVSLFLGGFVALIVGLFSARATPLDRLEKKGDPKNN